MLFFIRMAYAPTRKSSNKDTTFSICSVYKKFMFTDELFIDTTYIISTNAEPIHRHICGELTLIKLNLSKKK